MSDRSWCTDRIRRFRDVFPPAQRLGYLAWRLAKYVAKYKAPFVGRLTDGTWIMLRPEPSPDLAIAYEIMFDRVYDLPEDLAPETIHRIIDLGANVGYSCLYWARRCPFAKIEAFEPHPVHADLLRWHIARNGLGNRIRVHAAAAGTYDGTTFLTDEGENSKLAPTADASARTVNVAIVDFFEVVGASSIDILKIDIEGGEYAILNDPRFAGIRARLIVLEYHGRFAEMSGEIWCQNRLTELGYTICLDPDRQGQILRARLA